MEIDFTDITPSYDKKEINLNKIMKNLLKTVHYNLLIFAQCKTEETFEFTLQKIKITTATAEEIEVAEEKLIKKIYKINSIVDVEKSYKDCHPSYNLRLMLKITCFLSPELKELRLKARQSMTECIVEKMKKQLTSIDPVGRAPGEFNGFISLCLLFRKIALIDPSLDRFRRQNANQRYFELIDKKLVVEITEEIKVAFMKLSYAKSFELENQNSCIRYIIKFDEKIEIKKNNFI